MNAKRNIRLSIKKEIADEMRLMGYTNVYTESNMRAGTTPTSPFCYIVDSFVRPMETTLPFIVIEIPSITKRPFEVGNSRGRTFKCILHVFGKSRGQRDDIATYIQDNLPSEIKYYDFSSGESVIENYTLEIKDYITVEDAQDLSADMFSESSLVGWTMVIFEGDLLQ